MSRMLFFSGGGVTFTGGEATVQYDELFEILKLLKADNINTAIETNATSPKLVELSEYVDYLIMDFKHYDSEIHKKYTGIANEQIKKNFEALLKSGRELHIRIPLINGINTQNPEKFAEYFCKFANDNTDFEFLAYHEYGKDKWCEEYKVKNGFVSDEVLIKFKEVFEENNLKVIKT